MEGPGKRDKEREREVRWGERGTERQREREKEREREKDRWKNRETERDREKEMQRRNSDIAFLNLFECLSAFSKGIKADIGDLRKERQSTSLFCF